MHTQNLTATIRVTAPKTAELGTLQEQYAAAHGYTIKDTCRRPRIEHHGASDPLARMASRHTYLPGC